MKSFIACIVLAAAFATYNAIPPDLEIEQTLYGTLCMIETGCPPNEVLDSLNNVWADDPLLADWSFCFAKKFNMMSDDGTVLVDGVRKYQTRLHDGNVSLVETIISTCVKTPDATPELTALNINKCFQNFYPTSKTLTL